jgi:hypothetical protein
MICAAPGARNVRDRLASRVWNAVRPRFWARVFKGAGSRVWRDTDTCLPVAGWALFWAFSGQRLPVLRLGLSVFCLWCDE